MTVAFLCITEEQTNNRLKSSRGAVEISGEFAKYVASVCKHGVTLELFYCQNVNPRRTLEP